MLAHQPQHLRLTSNGNNPYLIDQLHFMLEQESTHYRVCDDYLSAPFAAVRHSDRRTMISWSYDIVDACSIDREAACVAASYFDRFMCSKSLRSAAALSSRREFQLAFIACLIIALKCRAGMQVDSDFVSDTICQGLYEEEEINAMEKVILGDLQWRLNGPSPHDFVGGLLELMPLRFVGSNSEAVVEKLKSMAKVKAEAAMLEYSSAVELSSSVAYNALMSAMKDISMVSFHPLDRLAWMHNVADVIGLEADEETSHVIDCGRPFDVLQSPTSRDRTMCSTPEQDCYSGVHVPLLTMGRGPTYCSPVSSSNSSVTSIRTETDEQLYFDVLAMASSATAS
eukprot:CAMPEP_0172529088 /NCGR_PEP_ID=MMETSP1067-20121228/3254_1 /TAXON_ID=265564 ORGANISM="Thalassiosira punctigera, Strain Tpunct2005C2" /NCGR_SAMPLE_ID=MMETSP1067 /ASSEMBLY_ACC=CAM_ASM_000444 /LENGTH=339 /DNA_ID=CAMNT_0013313081 /DNA_START=89 /DNA_END=1105 /DNA_ORIENTATION=+